VTQGMAAGPRSVVSTGDSRRRAVLGRAQSLAGPAAVIVLVQLLLFPMPLGIWLQGITVGLLGALVAVGMALVYRSNRILNFAQADLGMAPATLAVVLVPQWWSAPSWSSP
jgi:hypothetical protein